MRTRRHLRRLRVRVGLAGCVLACAGSLVPAAASGPERSNYIVQLRALPLATYDGDVSLAATGPRVTGRKLDTTSPEAEDYRRYLDAIESDVLGAADVSGDTLGYRYRTTLAGFSARLTAQEADRLRQQSAVASVTASGVRLARPRRPGTPAGKGPGRAGAAQPGASDQPLSGRAVSDLAVSPSPETALGGQSAEFLGLPDGLWARLGGTDHAGEGVVVGVVDTGVYPEHPSFADEPIAADGTRRYIGPAYDPPPAGWHGTCQAGEAFPAFGGAGFGHDTDIAAAIDSAVADGVDVLNLSIGGLLELPLPFTDQSTMRDPLALALLRAFDAGVVSVLAAGNEGPDPETVESPGDVPWVISAGASALSTTFTATATVSGGSTALSSPRQASPPPRPWPPRH